MGNNLQLTKVCMSRSDLCEQAYLNMQQIQIKTIKHINIPQSSQQLKQKLLKFIDQNNLYLYTKRQKKIFQSLVSINQQKLAEKGLQLVKSKLKQQKWQKFIQNVQNMKTQDLDGFFQQFKMKEIQIFEKNKKKQSINDKIQQKIRIQKMINEKQIRIEDKKILKKNYQYYTKGNQILHNNQLLIIAPVQCFSGIGALRNKTNLPSQATLLQMFISKIKAVKRRKNSLIGLIFIINIDYIKQFQQQISKIKDLFKQNIFRKLQAQQVFAQQSSSQYNFSNLLHYSTFPYHSKWPVFTQQYKISYNDSLKQIQFNHYNGDLLKYIESNEEILNIMNNYNYLQVTNLNNMLAQVTDATVLGYLQQNEEIDIVVKVIKPKAENYIKDKESKIRQSNNNNIKESNSNNIKESNSNNSNIKDKQFQFSQFIQLDSKGFIQIVNHNKEQQQKCKQIYLKSNQLNESTININQEQIYRLNNNKLVNTQQYFIKTRLILNQPQPLQRLLLSRIKKQKNENFSINQALQDSQFTCTQLFYFSRSFSSIFYYRTTSLILIQQQNQFSHCKSLISSFKPDIIKNGHIGYSLYCKKILGIKSNYQQNQKQFQQIVDIDAGILHKRYEEIVKLVNKLKTVQEIGFPLILYSDHCNSQDNNQNKQRKNE